MFAVTVYIITVSPLFQTGIVNGRRELVSCLPEWGWVSLQRSGILGREQMGDLPQHLGQLRVATALISGLATVSVGLFANIPLVIAPGACMRV